MIETAPQLEISAVPIIKLRKNADLDVAFDMVSVVCGNAHGTRLKSGSGGKSMHEVS